MTRDSWDLTSTVPPAARSCPSRAIAYTEWSEGNFEFYEEDKIGRPGPAAVEPERMKYKRFSIMAADLSHACFLQPKDPDVRVWRYMDLAIFCSLLQGSGAVL